MKKRIKLICAVVLAVFTSSVYAHHSFEATFQADAPQVFCDAPGMVRQVAMTPHPFRITQYDDRVVFDYSEYGGHRGLAQPQAVPPGPDDRPDTSG